MRYAIKIVRHILEVFQVQVFALAVFNRAVWVWRDVSQLEDQFQNNWTMGKNINSLKQHHEG